MGLFGRKKEEAATACSCGGNCAGGAQSQELSGSAGVKVLGSGCAKCNELEANVRAALEELGMDSAIEHVADFAEIAAYGVMSTPALVVDGKVVSYGKVLKKDDAVKLIKTARG